MPSRVASWHQGSSVSVILTPIRRRRSSRPWSVIFGNRIIALRPGQRFAEGLPVDLARRRLGQLGHERDVARVLVLTEPGPCELLQLAREGIVARARADDVPLRDLSAQ